MKNDDFIVRNVGDNYVDPDWFAFHSFFTSMCYFVEEEHQGIDSLRTYITDVRDAEIQFWKANESAIGMTLDEWLDAKILSYEITAELYEWYQSQDWQTDFNLLNNSHELLTNKLKKAADVMWCWWT